MPSRSSFSFGSFLVLLGAFVSGWFLSAYYYEPLAVDVPANSVVEDASGNDKPTSDAQPQTETRPDLRTFWEVWDKVNEHYVRPDDLKTQDRIYGAISGMVKAVGDAYTIFLNPRQSADFNLSLTGEFEGVGMELSVEKGALTVISPLKNSPAERAGVKPGDVVYAIDDKLSSEMTLFDAIMNIRGPKGTSVKLTLLRKDVEDPIEVSIVREKIELDSVTFELKDQNIAYISINQFDESTVGEFRQAVNDALLNDVRGVILDLRFNGGGLLDSSVEILSEFLEGEKPAVIIKQRNPQTDETIYTYGGARMAKMPMVVLVNEGSASASEILAGAIQDHKRGIIMGTQTFGKGSVQQVFQLEDKSTLRITVALWYTPNGKSIEDVGITPDKTVQAAERNKDEEVPDLQLEEAINYLKSF